ncbi:MAG: nuclear transport factor 2 family protein [Actinomycetota bacterium]|nr:nuclear transport factor 2 family protein [Actinomycetota bacterium]
MTKEELAGWLQRYVEAWRSYDPDAVGDLFTEDAEYRYHPYDEPVRGRAAIAASWREEDRRDEPGTWEAHYEPLAIDADVASRSGRAPTSMPREGSTASTTTTSSCASTTPGVAGPSPSTT